MEHIVSQIRALSGDGDWQAYLVAAGMIVATAILSSLVTSLIERIMRRDGVPLPSSSILVNVGRGVVWALGISFMLSSCFNIDVDALITAVGVGGIALSLGLQDTIKNFIGGLQVTLMRIVQPGDHVVVGNLDGIVQDVSWRQTVLKDFENVYHLIPNAVINSSAVSRIEPENLVTTNISFTNDCRDLDELIAIMEREAKAAVEKVAPLEKAPWILLTQIGEYGTWAKMRFTLKDLTYAREARDAALRAIAPYTRNDSSKMLPKAEEPTETGA